MAARPRAASTWGGRLALVGPGLALLLGALAYRPLLLVSARLPFGYEVEGWLFRPDHLPAPFVVGIAAWLLWRRRKRLASLPSRPGMAWTAAGAVVGGGVFVWALLTRATDLLLPSLAANLFALAAAAKGRAGCRAVLLPACVLLFGLRIPEPLLDEFVWHLQLSTAAEAAWLLRAVGYGVEGSGVILYIGEHTFHVIDSCSGMRGIQILTLVGLIVRELFASSGPRQWWVVIAAPILGHALNAVRVALIAVSSDPDALVGRGADHSPQGIAVLVVGTVLLYGLGWGLASGPDRALGVPEAAPGALRGAWSKRWWGPAAAWLGLLAVLSVVVSPFPQAGAAAEGRLLRRPGLLLPESRGDWISESLAPNATFISSLPEESRLYRRYSIDSGPAVFVEVFVGFERSDLSIQSSRLFSSKRLRPGPEWTVEESEPTQLWLLGREADLSVVSRAGGTERALVYCWRLRDEGFWTETLRSLLALESTPFRPEGQRAVVRLATPLAGVGPGQRARAKRVLDRFINDFRRVLEKL